MTEQYKPGDMALVTMNNRHGSHLMEYDKSADRPIWIGARFNVWADDSQIIRVARVAIIDPEDGDAVLRLTTLVVTNMGRTGTSHAQDLMDALRDYVIPPVSPAEALYNESKCDGEKPWADLLPETRHGWQYAARTLAEFSNDAKEDPEALPKRYERPDAGEATITDGEGDTLRMERPSDEDDDRRFFITSSGGAYIRRDQFRQLAADLTPWMNGAES